MKERARVVVMRQWHKCTVIAGPGRGAKEPFVVVIISFPIFPYLVCLDDTLRVRLAHALSSSLLHSTAGEHYIHSYKHNTYILTVSVAHQLAR